MSLDHVADDQAVLPLWFYQLRRDSKVVLRSRKSLEQQLIVRALKDVDFRRELLIDPKGVVQREMGVQLPESLTYTVLQETQDELHLVLPCYPYPGSPDDPVVIGTGTSYEDTARWVVEGMSGTLLDDAAMADVLSRAWHDPAFMRRLLATPEAILEQELGIDIGETVRINAFLETPTSLAFVIPDITGPAAIRDGASDLDDLLMLNILSGPCDSTERADSCGTCET